MGTQPTHGHLMKRLVSLYLLWMLVGMAFAQNAIYVWPPVTKVPVNGTQSIKATVTGNTNKTINWTTTCGTLTASSSTGATVGLSKATTGTCTVTGTMAADGTKTATSAVTFESVRPDLQAASIHPRIGLTSSEVTDLIAKAAFGATNVAYTQGLANYFVERQTYNNATFCWTGGGCGLPGPISSGVTPNLTPTAYSIASCVITLTVTNTFSVNQAFNLSGYATSTFLNNQTINVSSATGGTVTGPMQNCHANTGTVTESGTISGILQTNGGIGDGVNDFTANGGGPFESDAVLYALMALIDPTTGNRPTWAAHAHDMSLWEMNEVCAQVYANPGTCVTRNRSNRNQPFIGNQFIMNNRAQTNAMPLIKSIDWNYASFTSGEIASMVQVGHLWGQELTGALGDGASGTNEFVTPVGAYNDPAIINKNVGDEQGGANNFAVNHFQVLVGIGLLFDPADDIPIASCASSNTTICNADGTAKTVSAYGVYSVKGWLYRLFATFEDQHIVNAVYALADPFLCPDIGNPQANSNTINCTGSMAGGFSSEGTGYGSLSMSMMFPAVYNLYLAGKLDPAVDPQASFISSSYWDKQTVSFIHQLQPDAFGTGSGAPYTQFGSDASWIIIANTMLNDQMVYDAKFGSSFRVGMDKWYSYNAQYQNNSSFTYHFIGCCGSNSTPGSGYLGGTSLYISNYIQATGLTNDGDLPNVNPYNPSANTYDPRNTSTLPLDFENLSSNGGFYRYYGRDNWTTTATQFQFGCNTPVIDHAMPSCGRFDYLRAGEPLTVGLGGSSNSDGAAQAPSHQNIPGYQWNSSFNCNVAPSAAGICLEGGMVDTAFGITSNLVLATSSNSSYYYAATDASGSYIYSYDSCLYCSPSQNVTLSQREIVWLKPDQIFIYDRSSNMGLGTFNQFVMNLQQVPTISGNRASMNSTGGQKLYVNSLLPGTSSFSNVLTNARQMTPSPMATQSCTDGMGTTVCAPTLIDAASGVLTSIRMLHTIEGRASGSATSSALVQSSAGTDFDGGTIGATIVMFKKTLTDTFTSLTYAASSATTHYITGLAANTNYGISGAGTPGSATTDVAGVLTFSATGTGNIVISGGSSPVFPRISGAFRIAGGGVVR